MSKRKSKLPVGPEMPEVFDPLYEKYCELHKAIKKLPASRMRSMALLDLESSFSRVVFAVSAIHNPLGVA